MAQPLFTSPVDLLLPAEREQLERAPDAAYALDPELRVRYVNPLWRGFVERHASAIAVARRWRLGGPVLDAVDPELRAFYERILGSCLARGRGWSHDFHCSDRCDGSRYRIDVRPLPARRGLVVAHRPLSACPHAGKRTCASTTRLESYEDEHGMVVQCIHCRRVRSVRDAERWDLVPAWFERTPAHASGGLCESCAGLLFPGLDVAAGPHRSAGA